MDSKTFDALLNAGDIKRPSTRRCCYVGTSTDIRIGDRVWIDGYHENFNPTIVGFFDGGVVARSMPGGDELQFPFDRLRNSKPKVRKKRKKR